MTTNHPCSVDVSSMVDGLMNSSEESALPPQLFSALTDAERMQLCVHQVPVAVSLDEAHNGASTMEEVEETDEEDDIEYERREMMKAAAGINHGVSDNADPLVVKQQLSKEEIIAAGKTKSRNVWSPPKNIRKTPIDHDDYDLEEETIPGLEGFIMEGGGSDDALLLAALDDIGAASGDGPGLSSVRFDNYSLEDNGNSSSTAASPFPFGEGSQVPRASRNITTSSASPVAASKTANPSTTKRHNDPEPRDHNDAADMSTSDDDDDLEEEDALALLAGCEGDAKEVGAAPAITNIKEELREVHTMIEEHTVTEVLPFSAPASDDEGPLTSKPMSPYE